MKQLKSVKAAGDFIGVILVEYWHKPVDSGNIRKVNITVNKTHGCHLTRYVGDLL